MNLLESQPWPIIYRPTWNDLDSSKLQNYIECPRMYFFEHVLGWRTTTKSNHLVFGSAVHVALEHLYINGFTGVAMRDAFDLFLIEYRKDFPEHTDAMYEPKTPARFLACLIEYVKIYSSDFNKYAVVYTEVTGRVDITPTINMIFKIDVILREKSNGHYKTLEHKTKQGGFSGWYDQLWADQWVLGIQAGTYTHALYSLYEPDQVDGVLINGLGFKKTKSHLFEFSRVPVYKSPAQMQVWLNTIHYWLERLQADFAKLSIATDSDQCLKAFGLCPKSCTNWGRLCSYHDFCTSWPNPLTRCHEPPMGFQIEFWDPLDESQCHSTMMMDLTKSKEGQ